MSVATEAVIDIQEALSEYGSSIQLVKYAEGVFNPSIGETAKTTTTYTLKAFVDTSLSSQILNTVGNYDVVFKFYFSEVIDESWKIVFQLYAHEILSIRSSILQDTTMMYEVVCKR